MIFMVIRDPPGGNSFTTVRQGSKISFDVAVAGMNSVALSGDLKVVANFDTGVETDTGVAVGGFFSSHLKLGAYGTLETASVADLEHVSFSCFELSLFFTYY
jgi:hypothetical protein